MRIALILAATAVCGCIFGYNIAKTLFDLQEKAAFQDKLDRDVQHEFASLMVHKRNDSASHVTSTADKHKANSVVRAYNDDEPMIDETWTFDEMLRLESQIRDRTVPWRKRVNRLWLNESARNPPAMLLLTKYGWNQRNPYIGRVWGRSLLTRKLLQGIMNHPWFHPTAWDGLRLGNMRLSKSTRYYVFLDMETCGDKNYPHYGNKIKNLDQIGKRGRRHGTSHPDEIKDALNSSIMALPNSRIVIFDCNGYTRSKEIENQFWRREWNKDERLVLMSESAHESQLLPDDLGLPPPPCQKCNLTQEQRDRITACTDEPYRPFLLTFTGNFRHQVRKDLRLLHNNNTILVTPPDEMATLMEESDQAASFKKMASLTQFAAVPRGDNLFSYRFSEVMGCGAIPVVYADGWVFPFRKELIDPASYAVIIPQADVNRTEEILSTYTPEVRCRMRRKALEVYDRYFENQEATIRGLVESLELSYKLRKKRPPTNTTR